MQGIVHVCLLLLFLSFTPKFTVLSFVIRNGEYKASCLELDFEGETIVLKPLLLFCPRAMRPSVFTWRFSSCFAPRCHQSLRDFSVGR
jgi:hypothetical protein